MLENRVVKDMSDKADNPEAISGVSEILWKVCRCFVSC